MKIKLLPFLTKESISGSVSGDVLTVNGDSFDFTPLKDGFRLPASAISSEWFVDYVERKGQTLHMTLRLPVQAGSPDEYRNPVEPMVIDARSGPVKFPDASPSALSMAESTAIQEEK